MARLVFGPDQPKAETTEAAGQTIVLEPQLDLTGQRIGRYKLLERIGEGGFGEVYMAEQIEPVQRKVAFKIIKAGMDSRQIIARFEAERQALALMDHANIAKILDAGTTETGRPYFVMELVRGISITSYCDQKRLSTTDRLKLFTEVCHAVQHAHQKGIIHRDIKPSNVLVTLHDGEAVPKVIDFGISKALGQKLTDKTLFTGFAQLMGTPAYMSPEQAELSGLDIDTRSDIYSLGVLLYELLSGKRPFDDSRLVQAGVDEIRRIIREEDPPRPSTRLSTLSPDEQTTVATQRQSQPPKLRGLLQGDLDWIVMKCLEKERNRRYETANGLSMDIVRHLNDEAVVARPASVGYRLRKIVHRNKLAFAAGATVVAVLVIGTVVSTWQAVRAKRAERVQRDLRYQAEKAEKKATAEADKSREVARFLQEMLSGVGPSVALGRDTTMLKEVLDKTAERFEKELKAQPEVEAELGYTVGDVYFALAQYDKAEAIQRKVLALRKQLYGEDHPDVALAEDKLGNTLVGEGKLAEADEIFRLTLARRRRTPGQDPARLADSLDAVGGVLWEQWKLTEAEPLQREALALRQKALGPAHSDIAISLCNVALNLNYQGRNAEAEVLHRQALDMRRQLFGTEHPETAYSLHNLSLVLLAMGQTTEAEPLAREALTVRRKLFPNGHTDTAASLHNLAGVVWAQGKFEEAEALQREGIEMYRRLLGPENIYVTYTMNNLGTTLLAEGRLEEAEKVHRDALAIKLKLLGQEHKLIAISLDNLALVLRKEGNLSTAEATNRAALAMRVKLLGEEHADTAMSLEHLATVLSDQNKYVEAEPLFRQCLAIREKKIPDGWLTFKAQSLLGGSLLSQKKYDTAEPLLLTAYDGLKKRQETIPFDQKVCIKETADRLVRLYTETAQSNKAADWTQKLAESRTEK